MLVGLGISVVPLDTAVNIAFPDITGSFGLPIPMIQWVVICYVLSNAGPLLAFGRIGDMVGHGRVFRAGLLWSVVAFLLVRRRAELRLAAVFQGVAGDRRGAHHQLCPGDRDQPLSGKPPRTGARHIYADVRAGLGGRPADRGGAGRELGLARGVLVSRADRADQPVAAARAAAGFARTAGPKIRYPRRRLLAAGLAGLLLAINAVPRLADGDYLALALIPAAAASLAFFVWWEGRAPQPIVRIELFRRLGFAIANLASCLMYLLTFSVMLIVPYFLVRYTGLALPQAGLVLATGFIAMAATSPFAGAAISRLSAERVAPLGALAIGTGLFLVGSWQPDTAPALMMLALALHGIGLGLFQVAYLELVMAASPAAHRGVSGSLAMLTRTIGTVTGAAGLTLGFQAVQSAARTAGAAEAQAFLTAFHTVFRCCGVAAALIGVMVFWSARRSAAGSAGRGL